MAVKLGIVVPCYNEEAVLRETARRIGLLMARLIDNGKISVNSAVYFVDDGSRDATWAIIEELAATRPHVAGIKLAHNRGHQNALIAGLFTAQGDVLVSVDADLQDDIEVIETMLDEHAQGAQVVYGVRKRRDTDSVFKRVTARTFYRLIAVMGAETIPDHADFRLMSRTAIEALQQFREVNLFLRGMVPLVGFQSAIVHYDRNERFAGESKYPLPKMVALALDAITSFSVTPLRFITLMGFIVSGLAISMTGWSLWIKFFTDRALPGWTSIAVPLSFLSGIQLLCLGIIGEYLGKIYQETKARPRYIVERVVRAAAATVPLGQRMSSEDCVRVG